jgi:hypothetical protein
MTSTKGLLLIDGGIDVEGSGFIEQFLIGFVVGIVYVWEE